MMESVKIEFNIPKDIMSQLNESVNEFKSDIMNNIAIELYNKGKLTLSKSAELANLCKKDFIKLLSKNNSSLFNWDKNEIDEELNSIDNVLSKLK